MNYYNSISAKNLSGVLEGFLIPRAEQNATYLNYGTGGFFIRNNTSSTTMIMDDSGQVGIGKYPNYALDVSGNFQVTSGPSNTNPSVIITKNPGSYADFGTQNGW